MIKEKYIWYGIDQIVYKDNRFYCDICGTIEHKPNIQLALQSIDNMHNKTSIFFGYKTVTYIGYTITVFSLHVDLHVDNNVLSFPDISEAIAWVDRIKKEKQEKRILEISQKDVKAAISDALEKVLLKGAREANEKTDKVYHVTSELETTYTNYITEKDKFEKHLNTLLAEIKKNVEANQ